MRNDHKLKPPEQELKNISFKYLSIIGNTILWIDRINESSGNNNAIFARPFKEKNASPQQLTENKFNIKSNFHGYGGKSYNCIVIQKNFYLIWIDQVSNALWFQIFKALEEIDTSKKTYLFPVQEPKKLTKSIQCNFDSSFVITKGKILYGICEMKNSDYLFSLNLEKTNQDIHKIKKFNNFASDLSSNISANLLSWIEWDSPFMSWEKNDLFFAVIEIDGGIKRIRKLSNKFTEFNKTTSFFQPYWLSETVLVCSEDSSGWWNLLFIDVSDIDNIFIKKKIEKECYEYGSPQWVSGITFFSGSFENLFCLVKSANNWKFEHYQNIVLAQEFDLPFSKVNEFCAFDKKLVLKGHGPNFLGSLLEIDFEQTISSNFVKDISANRVDECSKPESFWFKGFNNKSTHSFVYRPLVERFKKPPLIIKAHSGPTSCFDGSYNSEVQYWTSKGFFVAEVNYGGSSGFGREYRDRLNYNWGIVDSYDCKALVIELIRSDLVDSNKVAIFGNSAGGLTALNSLCESDFFKVAICKYPVLDLTDMHHNTHRFEKDYLNSLIGNFEQFKYKYKIRSPIYKINTIRKPILLFHGKKDSVISYVKSLEIEEQLIKNNKYSKVIFFENEGHGFKNIENKQKVIRKTEEFLRKTLNI